jgi:CheY-like chemotaxis protein
MAFVLIIDADQEFAEQTAAGLAYHGLKTSICNDGQEGIDAARLSIPDAIVLCVELPHTSGYSICTKIKRDAAIRSVPLVITSSEATEETFEHHRRLKTRAEEYLRKPFSIQVLLDVLSEYIALPSGLAQIPLEARTLSGHYDDVEEISADAIIASPLETETMASIDDAIEELSQKALAQGLQGGGRIPEPSDDDEVMTSVGLRPGVPYAEAPREESQDLRHRLLQEQDARANAEHERDRALAEQRAVAAELEAMHQSQTPERASQIGPSRDLLAVKKQLNAKERELLDAKQTLHEREGALLALRDRESELEARCVELEDTAVATHQALVAIESKLAAAEARTAETQRAAESSARSLNDRIRELTERVASLDEELEAAKAEVGRQSHELGSMRHSLGSAQSLGTRLQGEIEERDRKLAEATRILSQLEAERRGIEQSLDRERVRLSVSETEKRNVMQRMNEEIEVKGKVRKAVEIALALLQDVPTGEEMLGETSDEYRS